MRPSVVSTTPCSWAISTISRSSTSVEYGPSRKSSPGWNTLPSLISSPDNGPRMVWNATSHCAARKLMEYGLRLPAVRANTPMMPNCSNVTAATAAVIAHTSEAIRSMASIAANTAATTSNTVRSITSVLTWLARLSTTRSNAPAPRTSSLTMPSTRAREIGASADSTEPSRPESSSAISVVTAYASVSGT